MSWKNTPWIFCPRKGKAQLDVIDEERVATQRKSGRFGRRPAWHQRRADVARAGLIERESAQRIRASRRRSAPAAGRIPARRYRPADRRALSLRIGLPREHQILSQRIIRRVPQKRAAEAALGAEKLVRSNRSWPYCTCRDGDWRDYRAGPERSWPTACRFEPTAGTAKPAEPG
jgi:hypothetical protein